MAGEGREQAGRDLVVVSGREVSEIEVFASEELRRYLSILQGAPVAACAAEDLTREAGCRPVVCGLPGSNSLIAELVASDPMPANLGPDGFILRTQALGELSTWLITGGSETGVLYGVYVFIEELGATFLISGDHLPDPRPDLLLPPLSRVGRPEFERRGFLLPYPLNVHQSIWGLEDYRLLIDQMAKLRLNYLNLNLTGADPTLEYTFHGERNLIGDVNSWETGFLAPRRFFRSARTDQVEIGGEHFEGRPYMAPPELQGVRSQEEAHRRFKAMFLAVFEHAKKRSVKIGFTMDPTEIPYNFARLMRRNDRDPAHRTICGARVDYTDPLFEEHTSAWLSALFETYPDAVDLYFWNAEGYGKGPDQKIPEHWEVIERYRPDFEEAKRIFEENWLPTCGYVQGKTAQDIIDTDINQMEATLRVIDIARKLRPGFTVGFGFLFRGYLMSSVHRVVDEEIPFIDFHSFGVVAIADDINAEYYADMGERKRYIIPRMDDDDAMFGIPFYTRQFRRDGLFKEAKQAGSQGFVAQLFRGCGTEHHVQFLARGTWDSNLSPEQFYRDYSEEMFGPASGPRMERAFTLLEDADELMGWRGLGNFAFSGGCQELNKLSREMLEQDNPYDGPPNPEELKREAASIYLRLDSRVPAGEYRPGRVEKLNVACGLLNQALGEMESARATVSAKGSSYLGYLSSKTRAYIVHLQMCASICRGLAAYADGFIEHERSAPGLIRSLLEAERHLFKAREKAREAARIFAERIEHPSDLAILFLANVYNIQKVDRIADLVRRVANYHQGLSYWQE